MTKEEAIKVIEAHAAFMEKPMPEYGTEAHDDYRIEAHRLNIKVRRAIQEHPNMTQDKKMPEETVKAVKLEK